MSTSELDSNLTRVVGGVEVPGAGFWAIDPGHTEVAFVGRQS